MNNVTFWQWLAIQLIVGLMVCIIYDLVFGDSMRRHSGHHNSFIS